MILRTVAVETKRSRPISSYRSPLASSRSTSRSRLGELGGVLGNSEGHGEARVDVGPASRHDLDRPEDLRQCEVLQQESPCAGVERLDDLPAAAVAAEEDDRGSGRAASCEPRELEAVTPGIRMSSKAIAGCFSWICLSASCPSFARADDVDPVAREVLRDRGEDARMIVGEEYGRGLAHAAAATPTACDAVA